MATICSSFGTPPMEFLLNNDWVYNHLSTDMFDANLQFKSEPDMIDLFEDLYDNDCSDFSISGDVKKITKDELFSMDDNDFGNTNLSKNFDGESKVRNKNCMWSGSTAPQLSTSASSSVSDNGASLPLAVVTGGVIGFTQRQHQQQQQSNNQTQAPPPPTIVVAARKNKNQFNKLQQQQQESFSLHTSIKVEPLDDYEQQLQQHNIPNSKSLLKETAEHLQNLQHIPPGTSLLRKSNTQQRKQQQQQNNRLPSIKIPSMCTSEFVSQRDQLATTTTATTVLNQQNNKNHTNRNISSNHSNNNNNNNLNGLYGRPDTPHSLDDESALLYTTINTNTNNNNNDHNDINNTTTGFTHNVDLRACIMGSNRIMLPATDPTPLIDQLSKQLQDTSRDQLDVGLLGNNDNRSLAEVLDYIGCPPDNSSLGGGTSLTNSTDKMTKSMRNLRTSDYDSDDDNISLTGSSCGSTLSSQLNEDSMCTKIDNDTSPATSPISSISSSNSPQYPVYQRHHQQNMQTKSSYLHSDHSYTRCKDGMDDLGNLETPSDSDEEIDVVSIGDKKLPTNPSDKDRRALKTKFAHKFSKRVVKTANGVRTIPPRRRGSFELPYTPASSSPVKSVANSRYPSPASTPYHHHNQYLNSTNNTTLNIPMNANSNNSSMITINEKSRKRINGIISSNTSLDINNICVDGDDDVGVCGVNGNEYALPPVKKCRNKKQLINATNNSNALVLKRHFSFDETADTIEKRNLHNDMERQRRIGLKNLFDALKKQIPSIKDKERAPKVNILREAAKLCEALTREDEQLREQKLMLQEQLRMRQELVERLRNLKQE